MPQTADKPSIQPAEPSNSHYSVQEAAEKAGISAHTLRYYERAGLLEPVARVGSGSHRRYSPDDLRRVEFLKRMRATGMPIFQMRRYVGLLSGGEETLEERRRILENHRDKVCAHIAEQQNHLAVLDVKIANYRHITPDPLPPSDFDGIRLANTNQQTKEK